MARALNPSGDRRGSPQAASALREGTAEGKRVSAGVPSDNEARAASTRRSLTGLRQISARSTKTFAERLDLDSTYVCEWSPWLELRTLGQTLPAVHSGHGAF